MVATRIQHRERVDHHSRDPRIRIGALLISVCFVIFWGRLFYLMVLEHDFYTALAADTHDVSATLFPTRGGISLQDTRSGEEFPIAINRDYFLIYADTRKIPNHDVASSTAAALAQLLGYGAEKLPALTASLDKRTDPYEPIEQRVDEATTDKIRAANLPGIAMIKQQQRYYPEAELAAQVVGFVGKDASGNDVGQYGIEGYWNSELAGKGGIFEGLRSAGGRWIPQTGKLYEPPTDGDSLVLTIDRTLEYTACKKLRDARDEHHATSAALIIMDPKTGAILSMCSAPDFDLNTYRSVSSTRVFNNAAIFTAYEPGSVFKPLTMAAAINEELVNPNSTYNDTGSSAVGCSKEIHNANDHAYGLQTMTGILENSINTGIAHVAEKLGKQRFREYVTKFGFGVKSGITLDTEVAGNISSLSEGKKDGFDCYTATGAFGQGLTVTPLQMLTAINTIANGGLLMKPKIIDKIRHSNGVVENVPTEEVRRVLTPRAATLVSGMMTSVVDRGQARVARIPGYYVAGKTGTAQISGVGGYSEDTNHTFVGFAPADNPKFSIIIRFEKPNKKFADSTAAPLFADIAKFALEYYRVPPER